MGLVTLTHHIISHRDISTYPTQKWPCQLHLELSLQNITQRYHWIPHRIHTSLTNKSSTRSVYVLSLLGLWCIQNQLNSQVSQSTETYSQSSHYNIWQDTFWFIWYYPHKIQCLIRDFISDLLWICNKSLNLRNITQANHHIHHSSTIKASTQLVFDTACYIQHSNKF